jgi:hypothetical protein
MDRATRKLTIRTLQGRVALLQTACDAFSKDFEKETLSSDQKAQIAHRWDTALKEWRSLRFTLEQLQSAEHADREYLGC